MDSKLCGWFPNEITEKHPPVCFNGKLEQNVKCQTNQKKNQCNWCEEREKEIEHKTQIHNACSGFKFSFFSLFCCFCCFFFHYNTAHEPIVMIARRSMPSFSFLLSHSTMYILLALFVFQKQLLLACLFALLLNETM